IHRISWIKVKGHSDDQYNNRCDKLAVEQIKINTGKEDS
ncbi:ribonuclease HI, partial [Candidatus Nomurabacteria bacterium]|nr:ribonuclease HI [Candidatus Nomurabacteria bacterium]